MADLGYCDYLKFPPGYSNSSSISSFPYSAHLLPPKAVYPSVFSLLFSTAMFPKPNIQVFSPFPHFQSRIKSYLSFFTLCNAPPHTLQQSQAASLALSWILCLWKSPDWRDLIFFLFTLKWPALSTSRPRWKFTFLEGCLLPSLCKLPFFSTVILLSLLPRESFLPNQCKWNHFTKHVAIHGNCLFTSPTVSSTKL